MSEPLKENTSIITINNWSQFHQVIVNASQVITLSEQMIQWVNMGSTINAGCGCTKRQREDSLDAGYKSMTVYLTPENRQELKSFYAAEKITLKHSDLEFLSF
jgi:malate synthase